LKPLGQGFWAMEVKHFAGAWLWVGAIGKAGDDASAFINKAQGLVIVHPFQGGVSVALGLIFHGGDLLAPRFWLSFNHTHCLLVNEQDVIRWANISLILADSNPNGSRKINFIFVLHDPSCFTEQGVYLVA